MASPVKKISRCLVDMEREKMVHCGGEKDRLQRGTGDDRKRADAGRKTVLPV